MPTNTFPENLGRFKLIKELGRGAQGVVWQALDPKLERNVAVLSAKKMFKLGWVKHER